MTRQEFRADCLDRDNGQCVVPWCPSEATEVHHILERSLWDDGGYVPDNGASVCNDHHQYAETNDIPPQAFWRWVEVEHPMLPASVPNDHVDKWGEEFETPPWTDLRGEIKYPSTGHLPFSPEWDDTRADFREVTPFVGVPLVVTVKMDGGNAMLVKDDENPVRARNGKYADHQSFDMLKQLYWERGLYEEIPEHLQVFGEWLYAKHSIHYGCSCDPPCEDVGPGLDAYFQVFGVYDTRYDLWLSWPATEAWAGRIGFPTTPVIDQSTSLDQPTFEAEFELYEHLPTLAHQVVEHGRHEGIIVRSKFPFHWGQFERRVGKYVREGHVDPGEDHWKHRPMVQNELSEDAD